MIRVPVPPEMLRWACERECSLDDLQIWIEPLIEEEMTGKLDGIPLH